MKKNLIKITGALAFFLSAAVLNNLLYFLELPPAVTKLLMYAACAFYGALYGFFSYILPAIKKEGQWLVDYGRLLLWGIPLGVLLLLEIAGHGSTLFWIDDTNGFSLVFAFLLGHVITASLRKKSKVVDETDDTAIFAESEEFAESRNFEVLENTLEDKD
ncbi:MAG: hypothetical protein FWH26_11235 [Oscillospiraceae bacterium]|nr:hypothetical protein [Oscillospiraceae bacterium]